MLRRRTDLVAAIPDDVWDALTNHEHEILFAVTDCMQGRFSTQELRARLDETERLKLNWWLLDRGLPMVQS
jgi:hypothetical protein